MADDNAIWTEIAAIVFIVVLTLAVIGSVIGDALAVTEERDGGAHEETLADA